jgi:hypothetical protein
MFMLTAPGTPPPVGSFENKRDRLHLEKKKKLLFAAIQRDSMMLSDFTVKCEAHSSCVKQRSGEV